MKVMLTLLLPPAIQHKNDKVQQDAGQRLAGNSDAQLPLLITTLPHPPAGLLQR
ncbi:hypothetical protein CGRA01v4_02234 [Colletotrichum graminicola]|nr:hypothetical protein CGRA01v4_02234 [Colletotrichum graminicola]